MRTNRTTSLLLAAGMVVATGSAALVAVRAPSTGDPVRTQLISAAQGGPVTSGGTPGASSTAGAAPASTGVATAAAVGNPGMAMPTPGASAPNLGPGESIIVTPSQWPPSLPSTFPQAAHVGFHEFQVDCAVNHVAPDDPIMFPRQPGMSHSHTFVGATSTDAFSTTASLSAGGTSCTTVDDHSAYWFPTMLNGNVPVLPAGHQVIYYKSGIKDYNAVRAFPRGLRFVVGSPAATAAQFQADSGSSGWSCGSSYHNWDLPASCPPGSHLIVRYQAPSCWDGVHLDSADHRSHMAYPVAGACPASHPVALPMLEFKIAYPVSGDLSQLRLSSGRGYSWHADFFAAWAMPAQEALVTQCINGGGQCDAKGYDQHKPQRESVLDAGYHLLPGH